MTAASYIFASLGLCTGVAAVLMVFRRQNGWPPYYLWMSVMFMFYTIADALDHEALSACIASAGAAVFLWLWWTSGGGNNTKKRLRKWARKFKGVRRTAPAMT